MLVNVSFWRSFRLFGSGDGQWKIGWYFGDGLGMLLQLGMPNLLVS